MSLGELILNLKDYALYVLRYWLIIGLCGVVFAGLFVLYNFMQPPQYNAELTFVVKNAGGSSSFTRSIASALTETFGLTSGSSNGLNYYEIIDLAKSTKVQSQALLDSAIVDGKKDLLGNHIINIYELTGKYETIHDYQLSSDSLSQLNLDERKLMKILVGMVAGSEESAGLFSASLDNESAIISISITTVSEELSLRMIESIYNQISRLYTERSIDPIKITVDNLVEIKDSLEEILLNKEVNLAQLKDASTGMLYNVYDIPKMKLSREVQILTTKYITVVQNLGKSRFQLSMIRPSFTVIDSPFKPLNNSKSSWLRRGILGGIIGCFLAVAFIVIRRYIREAINSVDEET